MGITSLKKDTKLGDASINLSCVIVAGLQIRPKPVNPLYLYLIVGIPKRVSPAVCAEEGKIMGKRISAYKCRLKYQEKTQAEWDFIDWQKQQVPKIKKRKPQTTARKPT